MKTEPEAGPLEAIVITLTKLTEVVATWARLDVLTRSFPELAGASETEAGRLFQVYYDA